MVSIPSEFSWMIKGLKMLTLRKLCKAWRPSAAVVASGGTLQGHYYESAARLYNVALNSVSRIHGISDAPDEISPSRLAGNVLDIEAQGVHVVGKTWSDIATRLRFVPMSRRWFQG